MKTTYALFAGCIAFIWLAAFLERADELTLGSAGGITAGLLLMASFFAAIFHKP